jgi:2-haloacid dehalogenase
VTRPAVTFDVYSALIDSRTGGTMALARYAAEHGEFGVDPEELFVAWDRRNKQLHRLTDDFEPFRVLAHTAMRDVVDQADRPLDAAAVTDHLLASMHRWPPWPDVEDGLRAVAAEHRIGMVSNIDDDLLEATAICPWVTERVTSQGAQSYKPHAGLYRAAQERFGFDLVHVPASARDTRGALEAGLRVVRVRREGHHLDPDGPRPTYEVDDLRELPAVLAALYEGADTHPEAGR